MKMPGLVHPERPGRIRGRYGRIFLIGCLGIWLPIGLYLSLSPPHYVSEASLILPGAGASSSVNLSDIGQASTSSASAFSSNTISPTETYKRLLGATRIHRRVAQALGLRPDEISRPQIELVDQTGLILLRVESRGADMARKQAQTLIAAFLTELRSLREDELRNRADGGRGAIREYRNAVQQSRTTMTTLQKESGLYSVDQYHNRMNAADDLEIRIGAVSAELRQMDEQVWRLQAQLGLGPERAAAILRLDTDSEYRALIREMSAAAAALAAARAQYGPAHPEVAAAQAGYQTARATARARAITATGLDSAVLSGLDMTPDGVRADLLADLVRQETRRAGLVAQRAQMAEVLERTRTELTAMAPVAARLEDMQRDVDVAKAVFASAIARTEASKTDIYASYPLVQVLEDPNLPAAPEAPMVGLTLAAGIMATLALMVSLLLARFRHRLLAQAMKDPGGAAEPG